MSELPRLTSVIIGLIALVAGPIYDVSYGLTLKRACATEKKQFISEFAEFPLKVGAG
jgi:hypothetical protein